MLTIRGSSQFQTLKGLLCLSLALLGFAGCASTNRGKILETIAISSAVGVIYGQSRDEFKTQNSLMYGSLAGLTGGLVGLYVFDESKKTQELREKISKLEAELDSFGGPSAPRSELTGSMPVGSVTSSGPLRSTLKSSLPSKLQKLVRPGEWTLYSIDEWEQLDDTRLIHKDQILEFRPPELVVPRNN